MNAYELADGILAIEERMFLTKKEHQLFQNSATMLRQQQAELDRAVELYTDKAIENEALKAIVEKLTADWTDGFRNYEYNSDEPEENKLRDDVFAILRKAQKNG